MYSALGETSPLVIAFLSAVIVVVTYLLVNRLRKHSDDRRLPPALPSLPVVGSLPFLLGHRNIADYFLKTSKRLGDVFSLYAGPRYVVVLNGRKVIREALTTRGTDFAGRCSIYFEFLGNGTDKGIILRQYDDIFKGSRQTIISVLKEFGFGKRLMETRIQEQVTDLLTRIREMDGKPFYPHDLVMTAVGNVMLSILYGRQFDENDPKFKELMEDVGTINNNVSLMLDLFPLLRYLPYYRRLTRTVRQHCKRFYEFCGECLTEVLKENCKRECFVNSFVEIQGPDVDRADLALVLRDLTLAGLDTTTTTILWSFIHLANHRSVQDRLHAEIDAVIGRDRQPTLNDRKRLAYLEATILETMRLKTLIPLAVPHATLCDTGVNGYFVPAKTMVIANLYCVHHDPDTWQDPDQFRPERFLDESGNLTTLRDYVIPFSLSKRSCLGERLARQEVFLFIVGILQQFDICPPEGHDRVSEKENFVSVVEPLPFEARLIPRND